MRAIEIIFWSCAALIVYSYGLYTLMIWIASHVFDRGGNARVAHEGALPTASLLIVAHNEASVIESRIRNALAIDYPRNLLQIVVASDGSSDATVSIIRCFADEGVELIEHLDQSGKAQRLNQNIPTLRGEIIVLSDANTHIDPSALRKLVRWFDHPSIGVVCGKLILTDPDTGRNVDSLYWKYETFLKICESRLGALLGSNGAIYAMRRKLFHPIPPETLSDDFAIPLLAKQETGCDIIYDEHAIAREESAKDIAGEFRRRTRIGAGGFQSVALLWKLLDPRRGWIALTFFSHKILRWLCPFFMVGMILANVLLLNQGAIYRAAAIAQLAFYAMSALVGCVPTHVRAIRPLRLTTMFTVMNFALFLGFFRWLRGSDTGGWRHVER